MRHWNSLGSDRVFILEAPAPPRQVAGNIGDRGDFPLAAAGLQSPGRGRWREEKPMRSDREERIKERAYAIWLAEGRVHGRHQDHWHRAEREIAAEETAGSAAGGGTARRPSGARAAASEAGTAAPKRPATRRSTTKKS